jgi:exosome complex component RRP41
MKNIISKNLFFFILGTRCAAINAAVLALINAGIPLSDFVSACDAGYIENTPILG